MRQKVKDITPFIWHQWIKRVAILFIFGIYFNTVFGQYLITATPTSGSYYQDFNSLPVSGAVNWADLVTIPFWYMQRIPVSPPGPPYFITVFSDDGNNNTGNAYSYGTTGAADRALGSVGSSNVTSGNYAWGIQFQNTSGNVVSDFKVSYRGEQWRDGGYSPQTQKITYCYKKSTTSITNLQPSITTGWTLVNALNFSAPINLGIATALNGNVTPNFVLLSSPLAGLVLNNNEFLMMKWDDPKYGAMVDQGMSTDSVVISWTVCATPTTSAYDIIATTANLNDLTLQWTNGSGAGRYAVINTINSFTNPVDGSSLPVANPAYGGTGEQVVYAGIGNTVTVTNLDACREYYFRVYEYNCSGVNSKYCTATGTNNPAPVSTSLANLPAVFSVSGPSNYCSGDPGVNIHLSGSQLGVNYQLYLDGNPVGSPVAGTGNPIDLGNTLTAGTYAVVATYGTLTFCVSDMNGSIIVTISSSPVAPSSATVDRNHICADDAGNITLTSTGGSGSNHEWATTCGGTVIDTNVIATIPSPTITTTYFVRWTTPLCGSTSCQSVTITVDDPPTPANAGPSQSLCGILSTTLAGNTPLTGTGLWTTVAGTGTITFGNPSLFNTGISASDTGTYILQWTITNGAICSPSSSQVTIKFSDALTVTASSNTPVCSGLDINLNSDIAGATYAWTGPNSFSSTDQNPVIPNSTIANNGTYSVTVTDIPGGCPPTTNATDVVVNQSAIAAGAAHSNPVSVCAGSAGNIILSATGGTGDTLYWYEGSCGGIPIGIWDNLSIPSPTVTTTYYTLWSSNLCGNSSCVSVTVPVIDPPTIANAGTDQSLCGVTQAILAGNNPAIGTGLWTVVSGPGTVYFTDPNLYNTDFSASAMGVYVLRWTISSGTECPASSDDVTIDFSNAIVVIAGSNSPACEGDTIFLTSSIAGAIYSWSGPNGFASTSQNPVISLVTLADNGTYNVTVTNIPGGCPATNGSVTVNVINKPLTPSISSQNIVGTIQNVCVGNTLPYSITPATASSTYTWALSGGGNITNTAGSNQINIDWTTVGSPSILSVTETTSAGCEGNPVILNIIVNALPVITLPLDTAGATNNQPNGTLNASATGSPPLEYSVDGITWQNNGNFTGFIPGTYMLQVRDSYGCISSEPFTINNIFVRMSLVADTVSDCPSKTVSVSVNATGMINIRSFDLCLTYDPAIAIFMGISNMNPALINVITDSSVPGRLLMTWDGTSNVTIPDGDLIFRLRFKGIQSGISPIQWNDFLPGICGVFDNTGDPFLLTFSTGAASFLQAPYAVISGNTEVCLGEPISLTALSDTVLNVWTLPDGSLYNGQQYLVTVSTLADSGSYRLLTTNTIGCTGKDTVQLSVHPMPQVSLAGADSLCAEAEYVLNPGSGYASYLWQDGKTQPTYTTTGEGVYWVKVTDAAGCEGSDTVSLIVCPAALYIPTAFSPNSDGRNDVFRARYSDTDVLKNYKMLIYNRWGQLVFEGNDITEYWDGNFNGAPCPAGIYIYVILFDKPEGKTLMEKSPVRGTLTIIR